MQKLDLETIPTQVRPFIEECQKVAKETGTDLETVFEAFRIVNRFDRDLAVLESHKELVQAFNKSQEPITMPDMEDFKM